MECKSATKGKKNLLVFPCGEVTSVTNETKNQVIKCQKPMKMIHGNLKLFCLAHDGEG